LRQRQSTTVLRRQARASNGTEGDADGDVLLVESLTNGDGAIEPLGDALRDGALDGESTGAALGTNEGRTLGTDDGK
jgi:hypothetical protein